MVLNEGLRRKVVQVAKLRLDHDGNIAEKLFNDPFGDAIHCPTDVGLYENKRKNKLSGPARTSEY